MARARKKKQRATDRKIVKRELIRKDQATLIDIGFAERLAGDRLSSQQVRHWNEMLQLLGERAYSELLYTFTHFYFVPRHAHKLWERILENRERLFAQLKRDPGLLVSAADVLVNGEKMKQSFVLMPNSKLNKMVEIALRDGLTSLYDKTTFISKLDAEIGRHRRYADNLAVLIIDLDDFKKINDTIGHIKADEALKLVGSELASSFKAPAFSGRFGGEEFAVCLPRCTKEAACFEAERVRQRLAAQMKSVKGTASIGLALYPGAGKSSKALLAAADRAMYFAKKRGKNKVSLWSGRKAEIISIKTGD